MKRNVDLTQNRLFSQDSNQIGIGEFRRRVLSGPQSGIANLIEFIGKRHMWDYDNAIWTEMHDGFEENTNPLVMCGNASQRRVQRRRESWDSGELCDCCGADLTLKPWEKQYCLCRKCATRMDGNNLMPWAMIDEGRFAGRVFPLLGG